MVSLNRFYNHQSGSLLIEILVCIGLFAAIVPSIITGLVSSTQGEPQQKQRLSAINLLKESQEAVRQVRENAWSSIANGVYHPQISGNSWVLIGGTEAVGDFSRSITISDVYRDSNSNIATSGNLDSSTKRISTLISWTIPSAKSIGSTIYLTRYLDNLAFTHTSAADFGVGVTLGTQVTNAFGGEVTLANNNYAKWCSPSLSSASIDLPDGPPVAVAAIGNTGSNSIPNDVFVATSPLVTNSVKMAYLTVTANSEIPVPTLQGTFTLDPAKYSNASYVPSGINLTNDFKTNDIKYYTSSGGKLYALIATNLPDHEVVVVQIKSGGTPSYQDPVNKIYRYWTYFDTRIYQGVATSDSSPFGYGGISITVSKNRGYLAASGYLYTFDLSNIDSKTPTTGLDMIGCRIQLDGYDCQPGSGTDRKYSSGQTGSSWTDTTSPAHNDCSDGGNIELYADNDIYPVEIGSSSYVYVAVGAGVNPEFEIVNTSSIPSSSTSPKISNSSCGRISGGNAGWRVVGSLDFNTISGTEEAANSVFANTDGSRAYISSNGGIDSNHDGNPDSYQLYVLNTSTKNSPRFISGSGAPPTSGYYYGSGTNTQLYPRRSLTVLNGLRAILVGKDGVSDASDAHEYQVVNISNEATPAFCGDLNFDQGFNDLTSVTEADGDNFVYMVANTTEKQLKIIQGGPDAGIYISEGTYISPAYDSGFTTAFNRIAFNSTLAAGTSATFQVASADAVSGSCATPTYNFVGPGGDSGSFFTATSSAIPLLTSGEYKNPGRCFKYKVFLSTLDNSFTPQINSVTVNYSP